MQACDCSGVSSILAPSASSTSALPHADVNAAVAVLGHANAGAGADQSAAAVEMLKGSKLPPPVPHVSSRRRRRARRAAPSRA